MALRALKTLALSAALLSSTGPSQAQQGEGSASRARPAPVSGRVVTEANPVPPPRVQAISTARAVPPPADLNEPLLTPAEAALPVPQGASRTHAVPHPDHTVGKKKVAKTDGTKRAPTHARKPHVDKAGGGVAKKGGAKRKTTPKDDVAKKKGDTRKPKPKAKSQDKSSAAKAKVQKKPSQKVAARAARPAAAEAAGARGTRGAQAHKTAAKSGKQQPKPVDKRKARTGRERQAPSAV